MVHFRRYHVLFRSVEYLIHYESLTGFAASPGQRQEQAPEQKWI